MAKIGASAAIKKKKEATPVQQATPQPVQQPVAQPAPVGRPLVTATTGPVYTPTAQVSGTPVARATVGTVQPGTRTPQEIQATRELALEDLMRRTQARVQSNIDHKLNKLNSEINKANTNQIISDREAKKRAQQVSTINALQWLADYKAYRDTGSWNDALKRSLTDRYFYVNNDLEKYGNLGASNSYWAAKSDNSPANPLDTMRAARETLNGPQLAIDTVEDEKAADIVNTAAGLGAFGASSWTENPFTNLLAGAFGVDSTDAYTPYFMTTQQTKDYNWILENRGKAAAEEYRKSLKPQLAQTYADWNAQEFTPQFAKEHPVLAGLVSVGESYVEPLATVENALNIASGKGIDYTSPANIASAQKQNIRTEQARNIDSGVGRFLYNTLMSTADYAAMMPVAGIGKLGEAVVLGNFGASATNSRARELINQGVPEAEAFGWALLSGAVEVVTEKVSLDKLINASWKGGMKNFVKNMVTQGFTEGSEEVASDALNLALDTIRSVVSQDGIGPLEKEIQELEKKGATRGQATSQVILNHLRDTGLSFAGGALSGGIMGGGYSAFNYNNLVNVGTNIVANEDGTVNMDAVQALIERGNNMPADTISHRQAELLQQKLNEGKSVTPREAAVLYANNYAAEKNMPYEELLKLRKKEADPGEWQVAKDEAMEHADELNKDVRQLYERTVEEAVTNGATGKQAIAEFDRAYTSGFNKLKAPQTAYISEDTVQEIMQAAQTERTGAQPRRMAASRANAERNLDSVNNYAENGSKVYQAAVREALDNGATEEQARVAFNEVYSNVYANKPVTNTSIPLSTPTIANIREAALKDRFAAENKARADAIPVNTNAGVAISDPVIRQHVEQGRLTETVDFADEMGKLFGEKVSLVAKLPQNGQINLRTGEIVVALNTDFGRIIDRDRAMRATLGHELAHRMRQVSPKTWDKFTQAVIGADIDRFNADVNTMIRDTYKGDITRDAAQEEVLADYIGNRFFSGDIDSLRAMVDSIDSLPQRSGFIQHIVDMANWIKSKLTGQPANNAARIETEFKKMFKETQAKVQQAETAKSKPVVARKTEDANAVKYSAREGEFDYQDRINHYMTMDEARRMIESAFNLVKDWYEGEYKTADEWLEGVGVSDVAMQIENDYNLQNKYINRKIDWDNDKEFADNFLIEDVVQAYADGTLVGNKEKATATRINTAESNGRTDTRFYAPKSYNITQETIDLANSRVNNSNREAVMEARKEILIAAHNGDIEGVTASELNKKLRSWSNYSAKARELSQRVNRNVAPENQWTGIQNCAFLSKQSVSDEDIRSMVKEIKGTSDEYERKYIARTMLALDTHIDWSNLTFDFVNASRVHDTAVGDYNAQTDTIRIGRGGAHPPQTVAHEMGHALDRIWGRDITGGNDYLSESAFSEGRITDSDKRSFYNNFKLFIDSLTNVNDIRSEYTQRPTEVFARFVARFVQWTDSEAGNGFYREADWYRDKFTGSQYVEFIKLLQEKAKIDGSDVKYSRRDSEGRTLTPEQAEFFADSKARDADGNLLVLYHGTEFAGFNTFNKAVWMTTSRRDAGSYGAATKTYDPNEQQVDVSTKGGNYTIGTSLRFDTEQDRDEFLKNNPGAENYLTPREMIAAQRAADEAEDYDRYEELVAQEKADEKIRRAYRRYEDQHSEVITLKELIDNKNQYSVDDFKDAFLSIDRNAYFDDEYDNFETDEEFRDVLAEALEESFISEGNYDDFPVRVRIPAGKVSTAKDLTHIHNRIYEMYANVTRPYVYDAKGSGSEGNGAYYAAVQTAMDSDEYDGAIINNIRVGRYQELGTVVVAKDSSQTKLVSNQTPTQNPDIRYSKRASDEEYMAAVKANKKKILERMVEEAAKEAMPNSVLIQGGKFRKMWHHTSAQFTSFLPGTSKSSGGLRGIYFTPNEYSMTTNLGNTHRQYYLNVEKYKVAYGVPAHEPYVDQLRELQEGVTDREQIAEINRKFREDTGIDAFVDPFNGWFNVLAPELIKSADPVVYDDDGNVIPLSERFQADNPDFRYSKRTSSSKDAVIRRQQETIDRLRHEMVETHGVEPDPKAIADAAVQFGRDWNSAMPETEIKDAFADIAKEFARYRRLSNGTAPLELARQAEARFEDKCIELANRVVKSAAVFVGDAARAQELKQFVWNHPIQIDPSFSKEFGNYRALQAAAKGRIKLAKDGMPISRLYESLNEQFSDFPLFQEFEGQTLEPVEMLTDLLDVLNDFDRAYNPYDTADAVDAVASEIMNTIFDAPVSKPTFADRKAAEVNAAKAEAAQAREQARKQTPADIKAYYEAKLNDIKEQRDRYLADLVQAYKDRSARAKESEERARLLRIMKRLDRLGKKSNDARRAEIKDIVGNFDLISQRISNHKAQELSELADWVRRNKDNADTIITPQIADKLARLDKQHIADLRIGDVRAITEALLEIEHRIRTENRIIGRQERYNTVDLGKQIIQDVKNAPGAGSSALARGMDKFLINGLMRPETEFLRLVGFDKNSPLYEYTFGDKLSLLTGQKTMQDYQREANEHYFRKFLDDKEFMKSITGKNARAIEITGTDEQGKEHTVKVTPDFVMAMYMHSRNVQNLMHIVNYTDEFGREVKAGGMTVPDYKLYKDGKKTEAYNAGTKLTFTRSQFENQLKGLTEQEMEFIKAAQRYYSEMSQPRINDVSEQLLGYSLAKVDNYFRINTDPDYRGGDMENLRFDGTIEGMGWTKERVNGKNPILLIPLSEQLQKDIVAHSKYVGMAIPIRNFSKIYGITENTYNQNADGKWELQNAYASSVIKEINKKHPSGADTNYIRDLLADIQNPVSNMSALDKVFAALRSKYAGSVLTLNLGVALKQAASFPTAAAEIGWGPILKTVPQFVKAMGGFAKPMNQKTIDFISKYSPLMRLRTEGMSTQELADMQRLNHKIPGVLNWIQNVDVGTVAALWKASEEYVKQNFKDLKPGSEEFYQKVGDVHTRVITKTQPNYSELQRPGLLRSKSEITKTLMMFKTQPFQNFNILYEAVGSFKAAERAYKANATEETKAARDEARKRLAWAVSSQVVSNSVFAAMQVIWDIMRRKEDPLDDEDKNVQRLNNFFKNMISSWAGMVPGGSQTLEVVEKWVDDALVAMGGEKYFDSKVYGFELDASIEGLNKLVDLITNVPNLGGDIFGLIKGDENKEEYIRDLFDQFKDISTFFGIPTNNVMNITRATMEWAMTKGLGYSDEKARYLTDRLINGVKDGGTYTRKHYAELAIAAGEDVMQMYREDRAFDSKKTDETASEYLDKTLTNAERDKFEAEYGTKEIYVADRDSVTEEAFREFAEKYAQTNDGNGSKSAHDILTALAATDLSEDEKEAIYDLYGYKTPYEKAVGKVETETAVEEPVASTAEPVASTMEAPTRAPLGQTRPQGTLTSEVSVGNSQAPTPISKTSTRIRYSKDEMLNVYGANEMYLDTNPLKGDRLDEFNRAYAAVTDNNDSVSQKELAAALNAMGVSLEEGEQIWAAYSQAHADKWGDGWKKTYANYYSGGSSGGSSGGGTSKSSGGGGGRSSGGGGRSSGGSGSTQPVVGPYPGYSSTPAATYTQPVAMPEPVASAPQTPYTGLQRHSEGGNVDLTYRPVLRAVELRRKGWGNVLSDTVRNFVKSYAGNGKALNFTPIVLDEDGNYVRTLSPTELREYAEAVLKGEREDDLKLQVGAAYEGADAMAQAEKAAAEIAQLDKDYTQTA